MQWAKHRGLFALVKRWREVLRHCNAIAHAHILLIPTAFRRMLGITRDAGRRCRDRTGRHTQHQPRGTPTGWPPGQACRRQVGRPWMPPNRPGELVDASPPDPAGMPQHMPAAITVMPAHGRPCLASDARVPDPQGRESAEVAVGGPQFGDPVREADRGRFEERVESAGGAPPNGPRYPWEMDAEAANCR